MRWILLLSLAACTPALDRPCERPYWLDADGDGFGGRDQAVIACDPPEGYLDGPEDCNDADPEQHPDATEVCDGIDNDCDDAIDESPVDGPPKVYEDLDRDGWGVTEVWRYACPDEHWATEPGDCDDADYFTHPEAEETCEPVDRNCDGHPVLGAVDGEAWFKDNDGDGHGRTSGATTGCGEPTEGWSLVDDDCDDSRSSVHPGATEGLFDGVDSDCDGLELCPFDGDGDGFGGTDAVTADMDCSLLWAADNTDDCDDTDPDVSPLGTEVAYNGVDEDCDPATRDDDLDEDGVPAASDCDDLDPHVVTGC